MRDTSACKCMYWARVNRIANTGQMYTNFVYYNHKQKLPLSMPVLPVLLCLCWLALPRNQRKGSPQTLPLLYHCSTITVVYLIMPQLWQRINSGTDTGVESNRLLRLGGEHRWTSRDITSSANSPTLTTSTDNSYSLIQYILCSQPEKFVKHCKRCSPHTNCVFV